MLKKSVKTNITSLLSKKFEEEEFQHLFLIDVTVNERSGFIRVYLDGDHGVKFEDCQRMSRYLEEYLDADEDVDEKYTLEVSSPGVKRPLVNIRQYPQHIGRILVVTWKENGTESLLLKKVSESEVEFETLPAKKKKKKPAKEIRTFTASFDSIKEAIVKISFN